MWEEAKATAPCSKDGEGRVEALSTLAGSPILFRAPPPPQDLPTLLVERGPLWSASAKETVFLGI